MCESARFVILVRILTRPDVAESLRGRPLAYAGAEPAGLPPAMPTWTRASLRQFRSKASAAPRPVSVPRFPCNPRPMPPWSSTINGLERAEKLSTTTEFVFACGAGPSGRERGRLAPGRCGGTCAWCALREFQPSLIEPAAWFVPDWERGLPVFDAPPPARTD